MAEASRETPKALIRVKTQRPKNKDKSKHKSKANRLNRRAEKVNTWRLMRR